MTVRKHIYISGRVQGVGFRNSAQTKANQLQIKGFVQNLPDGRVFIDAEGEREKLESFIYWCKNGPSFSRVDSVHTYDKESAGHSNFSIKY